MFKLFFKSPKNLFQLYKEKCYLTQDLRLQVAQDSIRSLRVVYHLIFLFGIIASNVHYFLDGKEVAIDHNNLAYYLSYIIIGVVGILLTSIVYRYKNIPNILKMLPYHIPFVYGYSLCCYEIMIKANTFYGAVGYATIGLVTIICLHVEPFVYTLVLLLIYGLIFRNIRLEHGYAGVVDMGVVNLLFIVLSFVKRTTLKHDLLKTKTLEEHRDIMQSTIAEKTEELHLQDELLAKQNQRIIDMQNNTIISLSNLVENRDSDTGEHVRRTSAYVNLLALKAKSNNVYTDQLTDEYIDLATRAAPMHDIGKIIIPDRILKKPGKLTDQEFEEVKKHTTEGERIIQEMLGLNEDESYLKMTKEIAVAHHERWDGTGYPKGLKGEEIPLCARIMAIADVFDALVSPRCYKQPFTLERAMEIIKEESGTHFDPLLANLFLSMEDDALAIMDKYQN